MRPTIRHACLAALVGLAAAQASAQAPTPPTAPCEDAASDACYAAFRPRPDAGLLHYYASQDGPPATGGPTDALVALHGHPRDANRTFDAALRAVNAAGRRGRTLVVAPVFQVAAQEAGRCSAPGVPQAGPDDLLWTCSSWIEGAPARAGGPLTAFAALDALVAELHRRWPGLRSITVAGFSAGGQMVQHYIGFAAPPPAGGPALRYLVADPGTWLYFDPVRPYPQRDGAAASWDSCTGSNDGLGGCSLAWRAPADSATAACPGVDQWKYGTSGLPATLGRDAATARAAYAAADVHYLEGALDTGDHRGSYYRILDKSCAAQAQGPYRLQRGLAYAAYDRAMLSTTRPRTVTVVPGCAHDVACVFPSEAARAALFGTER